MGEITDPVIARFVDESLPRVRELYQPQLVLAFGSRARGDALEESDLDVIVVAEAFAGVPFLRRLERFFQDVDPAGAMDVLCYTPEEFARKKDELGTVEAAVEEGIVLYAPGRT